MRRIILIAVLVVAGIISYNDEDVEFPRPWLMLAGLFLLCGVWVLGAIFIGAFILHAAAIVCNFSLDKLDDICILRKERKTK